MTKVDRSKQIIMYLVIFLVICKMCNSLKRLGTYLKFVCYLLHTDCPVKL